MIPRQLSYAEARAHVLRAARPLPPESIAVETARGRALRETVAATHPLPPFDNSAMDGYAVRTRDLERAGAARPIELPVAAVLPAGAAPEAPLAAGHAVRIMTGAPLPPGADAIVPFEECERVDGAIEHVRFMAPAANGAHVRSAGADLAPGRTAFEPGRQLSPHDLALLVAIGCARVAVGPRPTVAVISTGDELLDPGEPLRPGAIRDSNAPMLRALVEEAGGDVIAVQRVSDMPGAATRAISHAMRNAQVTLSIGGVSAGDFDPVKADLVTIPGAELWRVAMKPGRPQAFAANSGRLFFGLPGNPASVTCVFETLVRPALRRLQGFADLDRPRIRVRAAERIESRAGRTDFVRVRLIFTEGDWWATPAGAQISGHLMPQAEAHALLEIREPQAALEVGESAPALLLRWPGPGAAALTPP